MKKFVLFFVFFILCLSLFSQDEKLEKDSLLVYILIDEHVATIIDSFIMETQTINYPSIDYFIYIDLLDNDNLSLIVDSRKQKNLSDSIILYHHPNCLQVLVLHHDRLIETIVCRLPYFDCTNCYPPEILKDVGIKQMVYYDEIPVDYFRDNPVKGEIPYEDQLTGWMYHYYDGEWHETMKVYHTDNY